MSETPTPPATHRGSCHCGRVTFTVRADIDKGATCNCSICSRMGWVLAFVPASGFELCSGADALTDYQFGKKKIHHPFCATCGVHAYSYGTSKDGSAMYSVNVRCLEAFEVDSIPVQEFDGKSL